ncbi:heterokaryon incompatibility protein-domain-containing protein [Xylariaceae sp. FL1019]|nr:heterokaryon incompatibility protein-domain-containing protein [Xylariaceae sp. FL1019]
MWLIRTDTFKLKYVIKPSSTSYAILSHTWTSDEITFQQITDLETARNLPGFAKIEKTCELARNHGLEYAWVDTCCIDKTSSVELLEAINSMYEWYQNAKICFVYLPDLAYDEDNPEAEALHDRLRDCRWWYRGWTLQELVAPESVSFFDSSWHQIGDKATNLLEIISSITDIDSDVLENVTNPSSVPIGIRMRWAAKRKTTRPEDIAYCLLGIFGINMPLLYGEGDKAFKRLQEEISKQSNDMSLFAWVARPDTEPSARHRSRGIFALHPSEFVSLPDLWKSSSFRRGLLASVLSTTDLQLGGESTDRVCRPSGIFPTGTRLPSPPTNEPWKRLY